jgi:TorA maturation chaperone TorD
MSELPPAPSFSALDEETARAEIYGLLAQLFYAAPMPRCWPRCASPSPKRPCARRLPGGALARAGGRGRAMQDDCGDRAEYDALFGGVGKPEVYLFGSHYLSGFLNEKPVARLRTALAELGLARDEAMSETEDHVAYLCEVMRYLIAGDDVAVANLTRQRAFFADAPAAVDHCACATQIAASEGALLRRARRIHPCLPRTSKRKASTCSTRRKCDCG